MSNENNNRTEQEYLELATQSQLKFNELESKINNKNSELLEIKKELISCYGYVRILDNIYTQSHEQDPTISIMIEVLREFLSQFTEDNILN